MNYIITESQLRVLIKEQTLTLPYTVKGSHTVPANEENKCDALHGFQLGRIGADMNGEVKKELDKFSGQGVWVSNVEVTVDIDNLKVDWVVTIDKSDDGQFWNGFTSRGAGCNGNIQNRWKSEDEEHKNGPNSIVLKIKEKGICKGDVEIELVKKVDKIFQGNNSQFSFVQGFYRYKCVSKRTNTPNQMQKSFVGYTKENKTSTLKDYVGEYTFIDKDKKEVIGKVEVENNNLKVSKGERFFYLIRTQGDSFEGEARAYHEDSPMIPKKYEKGVLVKLECTFNRNPNGQVCSVKGIAKALLGVIKEPVFASKNGVSCDAQPEPQKPVTPTNSQQPEPQKPVTPATPQQPEQKPVTPTTPQTNKTSTTQKPIKFLDVVSPNKYTVRKESVKSNKVISEDIENTKQSNQKIGLDAIFVGGIDDKKGYYPLEKQLAIFKQGFSGNNVKAFGYKTPYETILKYLTLYPKIPIFLFSAGCNLADEIMDSKFVDKKKVYLIEPWNRSLNQLNKSVTNAISKGLPPKNIFVRTDEPGRGYGISGASDSESGHGIKGHWNSLITVPQKLNY